MTSRLLWAVGMSVFMPSFVLYLKHWISRKAYFRNGFVALTFLALADFANVSAVGWFYGVFNALMACLYYWMYKNAKDDDDPRNKRKKLLLAGINLLPKPNATPVRIGVQG